MKREKEREKCGGNGNHMAAPSPVHNAIPVQGHEIDLTASSRFHRRKEHLRERERLAITV